MMASDYQWLKALLPEEEFAMINFALLQSRCHNCIFNDNCKGLDLNAGCPYFQSKEDRMREKVEKFREVFNKNKENKINEFCTTCVWRDAQPSCHMRIDTCEYYKERFKKTQT